jgi:hypothetical protein
MSSIVQPLSAEKIVVACCPTSCNFVAFKFQVDHHDDEVVDHCARFEFVFNILMYLKFG